MLDKSHWMLYWIVTAMYPQFLITLNEELEEQAVTVRVGQAVNTVGLAGQRMGISGVSFFLSSQRSFESRLILGSQFQTHQTPVRVAVGERAEFGTNEWFPYGQLEGIVSGIAVCDMYVTELGISTGHCQKERKLRRRGHANIEKRVTRDVPVVSTRTSRWNTIALHALFVAASLGRSLGCHSNRLATYTQSLYKSTVATRQVLHRPCPRRTSSLYASGCCINAAGGPRGGLTLRSVLKSRSLSTCAMRPCWLSAEILILRKDQHHAARSKILRKKATYPSLAALRIALSFSSHVPGFPFSPVFLETDVDVDSAEPRLSAAWACPSLAERSLSCEMAYDRDLGTSKLSAANYVLPGGGDVTYRDERTLAERVDPVFVP